MRERERDTLTVCAWQRKETLSAYREKRDIKCAHDRARDTHSLCAHDRARYTQSAHIHQWMKECVHGWMNVFIEYAQE